MRFTYLDGLRGLAALLVVARHWNPLFGLDFQHSYLAVDVFFLLSGFVIAHAYDAKLGSGVLSAATFMRIRFARLYPVYVLALAVSLALALLRLAALSAPLHSYLEWISSGLFGMAFLPFAVSEKADLFPLNVCFWSLSMEMAGNGAYAYARPWLKGIGLPLVVASAGTALMVITLFTGTADHGAYLVADSVFGGAMRCIFGIAAGLLLYQQRNVLAPIARLIPPWLSFLLVAAVLTVPSAPGQAAAHDLVSIFVIIPLAVVGAAAAEPRPGWLARGMAASGLASYPMYLLHIPLGMVLVRLTPWLPGWEPVIGTLGLAVLCIIALQVDRHFDVPARAWLRNRVLAKPNRLRA
jgi:peptidoglycan/LPS O-acetylase OafA/YrhL